MIDEIQQEFLRERLFAERDEILQQVQSSSERAKRRLLLIDAALQRMNAGEYGECRDCGEIIAAGRLKADPCALFCLECASARQD